MARCIAIHRGYCGVALREPGQEFEYSGAPAPWFKKIGPEEKPAPAPRKRAGAAAKGDEGAEKLPEAPAAAEQPELVPAQAAAAGSGDESVI